MSVFDSAEPSGPKPVYGAPPSVADGVAFGITIYLFASSLIEVWAGLASWLAWRDLGARAFDIAGPSACAAALLFLAMALPLALRPGALIAGTVIGSWPSYTAARDLLGSTEVGWTDPLVRDFVLPLAAQVVLGIAALSALLVAAHARSPARQPTVPKPLGPRLASEASGFCFALLLVEAGNLAFHALPDSPASGDAGAIYLSSLVILVSLPFIALLLGFRGKIACLVAFGLVGVSLTVANSFQATSQASIWLGQVAHFRDMWLGLSYLVAAGMGIALVMRVPWFRTTCAKGPNPIAFYE